MREIILILIVFGVAVLGPSPSRARQRWKVPHVDAKYYRPVTKGFRDRSCLRMLRSLKVPFRKMRKVKGVATPIKILGNRIGRTQYKPRYKSNKMLMDCRTALALRRASELFRVNGISTVVFSNFYCWRHVKASGRLSRHALGLAIDIHAFHDSQGRKLDVLQDYERGLGRGKTCEGRAKTLKGRRLRDLACDLDASNLFEAVLTPDYDADHHNHFHLSVFHPQDHRRYRLFRTVLMEVRGSMHPWVMSRPKRAFFSSRRLQRVIKHRWRVRKHWWAAKRIREGKSRAVRRIVPRRRRRSK
ncbi:MAG: extensin family protein [bacterium]